MPEPLRVLVVEDRPSDARLMAHELREAGFDPAATRVETEAEYLAALDPAPDVILCDYNLPQFDAVRALELMRASGRDVPFIIVSGSIGEETAVEAMKLGADDYLLKDRLGRLGTAVRQALEKRALREAERQSQAALAIQVRATAVRAAVAGAVARAGDLPAILRECCAALVREMGAATARVWTLDAAADVLDLQACAGLDAHADGLHKRVPVGDFKVGRVARDRQPHLTNAIADDPHVIDPAWVRREGLVAFAGYPLLVEGRLIGVLALFSRMSLCRAAFEHLAGVADLVAQFIERRRAEDAVRFQKVLLESQAEASADGILMVRPPHHILSANRRFFEIWGIPQHLAAGGDDTQVLARARALVADPEAFAARVTAIYADPDAETHEEVALADGRTLERYSRPVRGPGGEWYGRVWFFRDITHRKRAEEAVRASEEQYRVLAEGIPQIVWTARPDGGLTYLNRRALDYCGPAVRTLADWAWREVIHPDDLPLTLAVWAAGVRNGQPQEVEFRLRRADGAYRWHLTRQVSVHDRAGDVVRWFGTCTDIDDAKAAAARAARDAHILASVRDSVIVTDLNGVVSYWNEGAARLFGWTAAEMVGRHYADRFAEPARSEVVAHIRDRAAGTEFTGEYEDHRKDGTRVWIHAHVGRFADAAGRPAGILGVAYDITDQKQAEAALRLRDRAIQAASQGILITDPTVPDNPIVYASPGFERLTGYSAAEVAGKNCRFLQGPDTHPQAVAALRAAVRAGEPCTVEMLNYRKDGAPFWNALTITPVHDGDRRTHFIGVQTDVTGRKHLETQFHQAQKMEAVGQLAGGVAHDFNNILTVINGYGDLLLGETPAGDPQREPLAVIREAGERAAGLTAQLLAFSRKTIVEPKILDLNDTVEQVGKMLRRLIGEDVALTTVLAPGLGRVRADPGQVEQVLMNLAVNARDAMPTGGRLTIQTADAVLAAGHADLDTDCAPGRYVRLAVTDTGGGMPEEVRAKIFEPFFTTKAPGKGTGLGLATVYGIVKQAGGCVRVASAAGRGTTFTVFLPAVAGAVAGAAAVVLAPPARGTETLLLVEDEAAVRKLARIALENQGYRVVVAADGAEALTAADRHAGPIDLLVTDVVMPVMGGRPLAEALRARWPGLKVLYMSGYTDDAVVRHGVVEATDAFLQKPFGPFALARKVRAVLDEGG